jgi:DNA-binding SARP family transcriptional activator
MRADTQRRTARPIPQGLTAPHRQLLTARDLGHEMQVSTPDYSGLARLSLGDRPWPIMICLLGNFRLLVNGEALPIQAGSKSELFLTHLGLEFGRRVSREQLAQAIWPEREPALAAHSLRTLAYRIQKLLGTALQGTSPVLYEDRYYRLNIAAGIGVDIACFDALVTAGDQLIRVGDTEAALQAYRRAASLYRGELALAADVQMVVERERLLARYLTLLAQLADHYYQVGNYDECLAYLWRLLAREPGREDAHRQVMRCYVRRGERVMALHQYQVCVDILAAEYSVGPEQATIALTEQVRDCPESI